MADKKNSGKLAFTDYIEIYKALGEETRLKITAMLSIKPLCVCEIHALLSVSMSTLSNHLKILNHSGIINYRKEGRWIIYFLTEDENTRKIIGPFLSNLRVLSGSDRSIKTILEKSEQSDIKTCQSY